MLDKNYWTQRYENQQAQWDIGYASPALMAYMENKPLDAKVLIPGAGNAHEAEALWKNGFKNVFVLDLSEWPLKQLRERMPDIAENQFICGDFFEHTGTYDIILEQTFFCALDPNLRMAYVKKMTELLHPQGELAGLLFSSAMNSDKPPFGGSKLEYNALFEPYFNLLEMDNCLLSIPPRKDNELFFRMQKK